MTSLLARWRSRRDDKDEVPSDVAQRTQRDLHGVIGRITQVLAFAFAAYYMLSGIFGAGSPQFHRGLFVGGTVVLVFLLYHAIGGRSGRQHHVPLYDILLALLAAVVFGYFITQFEAMAGRSGAPNTLDTMMGLLAVVLVFEAARRTTGWMLASIAAIAIIYVFAGPYLPDLLAHRGFSIERFVSMSFSSFNGLFGSVATAFANFVFLFIVFGSFLSKSGAAKFFADLPFALAGHKRGGPAKVAVIMSGSLGSLHGSAVANVMTTGTFTIPAMLRSGYRREFAGGVEAAAGSGGGILPPVMGAGAFLIAEFSGIPYSEIILVSIIPALMYFAGVYFQVDLEAAKHNLRGMNRSELPSAKEVLRKGWYWVLPIVVVFVFIIQDYSPAYAGFWGTMTTIVLGFIPYRGRRMTLKDNIDAMWEATLRSLTVSAIVGLLGIIIAVLNLTGLGLRFSDLVVQASGGQLLILLMLLIIAAWVLGAGLTVTSAYVILAVIAVPALQEFGVGLLVAHMIIFWISQDVTPPVCVPAFAAASIAGGRMMATGWEAWKLARALYFVPFLMAFGGLLDGSVGEVVRSALLGTFGLFLFAGASTGFLVIRLNAIGRIVLLGASAMCIYPSWLFNGMAVVVGVGTYVFLRVLAARKPELAPSAEPSPEDVDDATEPEPEPRAETEIAVPQDRVRTAGGHDNGVNR